MVDGFKFEPTGDTGPLGTANNVVKERGITREESDALVLDRYIKYTMSTAEDRKFQKRYMLGVEVRLSRKKTALVEEDEGIIPCTAEGLAGLRPVVPDSIITVGAQTHAADGNAGMIVTTKEKAASLSADKAVTIQILSSGFARAKKAHILRPQSRHRSRHWKGRALRYPILRRLKPITRFPLTISSGEKRWGSTTRYSTITAPL